MAETTGIRLAAPKPLVVPILRAGLGMLDGMVRLLPTAERKHSIRAPWGNAPELRDKIADLRKAGEVVIQSMPGHDNVQDEFECDRVLVLESGNWILKNLG